MTDDELAGIARFTAAMEALGLIDGMAEPMWLHPAKAPGELVIAIDFDGTVVENEELDAPLGADAGAGPYLRLLAAAGVKLILWTVREGAHLDVAVGYWREVIRVEPWGINANPAMMSRKAKAHVYVDDRALGTPVWRGANGRPVVAWDVVGPMLMQIAGISFDEADNAAPEPTP